MLLHLSVPFNLWLSINSLQTIQFLCDFNKYSDERLSEKLMNIHDRIKLTLNYYEEAKKYLRKNMLRENINFFMVLTSLLLTSILCIRIIGVFSVLYCFFYSQISNKIEYKYKPTV